MALLLIFSTVCLAYMFWSVSCLLSNYLKARKLGLPIIVSPLRFGNVIWMLFYNEIIELLKPLPPSLTKWARFSYYGWSYHDKYHVHEALGDVWCLVTPAYLQIQIANGPAMHEITTRRKAFPKPVEKLHKLFEVFGSGVFTVEGDQWQRHRKITAPPFNERNSELVWDESLRQASDMLSSWSNTAGQGINTTDRDTMSLAFDVIAYAGFGISSPYQTREEPLSANHSMSYKVALSTVLDNFPLVITVSRNLLSSRFAPSKFQMVGKAMHEFDTYMSEIISCERADRSSRDHHPSNLLSSLVRASDEAQGANALTDDEILGNTFIFTFAGHETTAHTLAYAITLLAVYPDFQDWLHSELSRVLPADEPSETWEYGTIFPQLHRCLALMFETLRLYTPAPEILKWTDQQAQILTVDGQQYILPPETWISLNTCAVHTLPKYWGQDSLAWDPKRWIDSTSPSDTAEKIRDPPEKGTFVPWTEGPRTCPGKKFSQVEFVAVIAKLFRDWTVKPATKPQESAMEARERVMNVVNYSHAIITLQMKKPTSVHLVWSKRD